MRQTGSRPKPSGENRASRQGWATKKPWLRWYEVRGLIASDQGLHVNLLTANSATGAARSPVDGTTFNLEIARLREDRGSLTDRGAPASKK
jgi:hypothetical protein